MITTAFIYIGIIIVSTILAILPIGSGYPTEVNTAVTYLSGYVGVVDPLLPLDTLLQIIMLTISIEIAIWTFRGVRWLYQFTPFVGK